jgi:hypothetical protein
MENPQASRPKKGEYDDTGDTGDTPSTLPISAKDVQRCFTLKAVRSHPESNSKPSNNM